MMRYYVEVKINIESIIHFILLSACRKKTEDDIDHLYLSSLRRRIVENGNCNCKSRGARKEKT